ncbi:hypothetical protein [Limnospira platensis]|uniref:hypothetical protein n=1 Tax=Limnospira platensis TaxID=118562 RepID=UPI003D6E7C33
MHFTQPTKLESDRIYLGGKKIHFHHIPIVGFRCTSPNLQNWKAIAFTWGEKKFTSIIYPLLGSVALHPTYKTGKRSHLPGGKKNSLPSYTHCWVPLHFTQPTKLESDRIYLGGKKIHFHHIPIVGFRCTSPNLQNWKAIAFTWGEKKFTSIIYPLLGSVALHPTYKTGKRSHLPGGKKNSLPSYTHCWVPLHFTQPTKLESDRIYLGGKKIHFHHIPIVGFRCTSPNLQNWKAIAFTWGEKKFTSIIYPLLGSVALHPTYKTGKRSHLPGGKKNSLPSYTHCWVPLHFTQPTKLESDRIYLGGKKIHFHHIPIVGFRCTSPNLQNWKAIAFTWGEKKFTSIIYPLLGSVALHPTYKTGKRSHLPGGKKNSLPSYTHCWVPLHFTQPTKLESDRIYLGGKKIHFHHIPIVGFRCTSPNLQNWKAIAFTWGEKKFTSIIYPLLGSVALHPTYKTGKRSHLPGGKKNSLPSYTHCWVPLHFTQPTKLESDRIYLGGKKIHFHHIPIVGFRCTSPNLQNWKAIAFTWGEKKFTSIIYPLLGSVALHPTYKTGKRSHLPGGKKNSLPSYTHCWVPLHFTQPTKLESDRIYLGGKKIHFHHIPIVGFRCTSPNLQNWKAIAFTWGEKKFTSIIYPLLGSVALHPTYKTGKRSHLPGGKKNSLPSYTHCWVPLHFTQPTKLESDRIYLGGKKIHFHHIPIVGFRCTSPNLQNWKAIAFTWGEKKFTSIIYPLLGSVALHPTYKTGKRSHLPGGKKNSLPSYTHCWVPLHFTQPTKLHPTYKTGKRSHLPGGKKNSLPSYTHCWVPLHFTQPTKLQNWKAIASTWEKKIHFHHIPIVGFRCTSPNLQNWKAIAFTWGEKKFTSIIYPLLGSVALHPTYKTGKRSHLPGGKKNSLPSYTHCWVPLHFTQPTKLHPTYKTGKRSHLPGGKKNSLPSYTHCWVPLHFTQPTKLQNWKAIASTWEKKIHTSPPQKRLISESQKTLVEPGLG